MFWLVPPCHYFWVTFWVCAAPFKLSGFALPSLHSLCTFVVFFSNHFRFSLCFGTGTFLWFFLIFLNENYKILTMMIEQITVRIKEEWADKLFQECVCHPIRIDTGYFAVRKIGQITKEHSWMNFICPSFYDSHCNKCNNNGTKCMI